MQSDSTWANVKERGSVVGMRFMLSIYGYAGPTIFRLALIPLVLYFYLTGREARTASSEYLIRFQQRFPRSGIKNTFSARFRHFLAFSDSLLEKLAVWSNSLQRSDVCFHGHGELLAHVERGEGFVLLCAHIGCMEVCRALSEHTEEFHLNVLVHETDAEQFNTLLKKASRGSNANMIRVESITPATAMDLSNRVDRGEGIAIMTDRVPTNIGGRTSEAEFLGGTVAIPQGPFILSALMRCPVYTMLVTHTSGQHHIFVEHLADRVVLPRPNRDEVLRHLANEFTRRMEKVLLRAPLQWFNFYRPYWLTTERGSDGLE